MTLNQFDNFMVQHPSLQYAIGEDEIFFNDSQWTFYEKGGVTKIARDKLRNLSLEELEKALYNGLRVTGITRITGYFTKTNSWNKGKLAELRDRNRTGITGGVR